MNKFVVSALVDFPDDCGDIVFNHELVEDLIDRLHAMGASRVYWNFYQPGMWDWFRENSVAARETIENLGEPITVGCRFAHERGMEFYATIKPYETGGSNSKPRNTLATPVLPGIAGDYTVDPWVQDHPEMRVKCRTADTPTGLEHVAVRRIQLREKDMAPVRIKAENIQIWTSKDNNGYSKQDVSFTVNESVDTCTRNVVDINGLSVTNNGDPVRTLELTGLNLTYPFIAVTTNIDDDSGTFANTAVEMIRAFDSDDNQIPVIVASHKAVWKPQRDLRFDDLEYDNGVGDILICLDVSNSRPTSPDWSGTGPLTRDGVIAMARGRQEYVSGSLCEAYPEVQEYWMSWIDQCIDADVDGLDVRISNHSGWVNTPDIYGFNEPVIKEYERRYDVNPDTSAYDSEKVGAVRGDFFDDFLRKAKVRLSGSGKRLSLNCEMESFRPDACQARWRTRPGNITFNWHKWLSSGLADEATLLCRGWDPDRTLEDPLTHEMLEEAKKANIPVHISDPVRQGQNMSETEKLGFSYRDGRLAGYCFYETASMYDRDKPVGPNNRLNFRAGLIEEIRRQVDKLGITTS